MCISNAQHRQRAVCSGSRGLGCRPMFIRLWFECLPLTTMPRSPHTWGVCLAALPSIDELAALLGSPGVSVDPAPPQVDPWPKSGQKSLFWKCALGT